MSIVSRPVAVLDQCHVIPPLEAGDHLSRAEFERRYNAMPDLKKAELIEGVVYMPSPVRWDRRARPHSLLGGWLLNYEAATPGVQSGHDGTIRLDLENEPQPDAVLIIDPCRGGRARKTIDDYIEGPPELVAEVAASTASFDLHTKLRVYRRNDIKEYIVWRVNEAAVDWFVMRAGEYQKLPIRADGTIESETFPGLRLDPTALTLLNIAAVLKTLQDGIASREHAEFVERLRAK